MADKLYDFQVAQAGVLADTGGYWDDLQAAESTWQTDTAAALADWRTEQYDETAVRWGLLTDTNDSTYDDSTDSFKTEAWVLAQRGEKRGTFYFYGLFDHGIILPWQEQRERRLVGCAITY